MIFGLKMVRIGVLFGVFFSLTACEAVLTEQPLGDEVVKLDEQVWQGTWLGDEVVLLTTVLDAEKGVLQAAWLERGPDGARLESFTGNIRQTGDWMFMNLLHEPESDSDTSTVDQTEAQATEYYWARVKNDGKRTTLWWPNVDQIRQLVEDKTLPGTVREDNDVALGNLSDEQLGWISSPDHNLLNWSEPVVFIRMGD